MPATYRYPRPAVAVDCVVFGLERQALHVLLVQRANPPLAGEWVLPGGFVRVGESLEQAARRELREETGLTQLFLVQLYSFGEPDRDPREHVVTIAWYALVNVQDHAVKAATDARAAAWYPAHELPALAFDHQHIVDVALERLRGKVRYRPVGFELLPEAFTLTQLQRLYETILETELDKRNFRKKVLGLGLLIDTGDTEQGVARRPARLYRFDRQKYLALEESGFEFSI